MGTSLFWGETDFTIGFAAPVFCGAVTAVDW